MKLRLPVLAVPLVLLLFATPCLALTAGGQRTIDMLATGGPESIRDAAQTIHRGSVQEPQVLDVAAEVLLQTYQRPGFVQVDATAWLCKALGATGNGRYRGVLEEVAGKAADGKVRKYASQALGMLPKGDAAPYVAGTEDLAKWREGSRGGQAPPAETVTTDQPPPATGAGNVSFERIAHGMSMEEVYAILGQPTASTSRITGKAWAPFYHGGDTARMFALYKGKGRIVFSNTARFAPLWRVIEIVSDPAESGYP